MKNFKLTLLALTAVFALTFTACKKQDLQPDVTSDAKPGGGTVTVTKEFDPAKANFKFVISGNLCDGITLTAQNNGGQAPGNGTITVYYDNVEYKSTTSAVLTLSETELDLLDGIEDDLYATSIKAEFAVGNGNADKIDETLILTEYGCSTATSCGVTQSLEVYANSSFTSAGTACLTTSGYIAVYTVTLDATCAGIYKLQGGITNGATVVKTESVNYGQANSVKPAGGGNTTVTWSGITQSDVFKVSFTKSKSTAPTDYATGSWSLKDAAGVALGTYTGRMTFAVSGCQ